MAELWERQEWESAAAFRAFHEFYLPMQIPRSIDGAYRCHWLRKRGIESGKGLDGVTKAPRLASGRWRYWSQGRDQKGDLIPGAVGWIKRAEAWDAHLVSLENAKWEQRVIEQREADWQASQKLRDNAVHMLRGPLDGNISAVARAIAVASKIGQLATGEPTERVEVTDAKQLTDEQRADRVTAILNAARARRAGQSVDGQSDLEPPGG